MYRAIAIKNWIISEISPFGWSTVVMRALPELLEYNPRFSAYYVGKNTKWSQMEVEIIQYYLTALFNRKIPMEFLYDNLELPVDYMDLVGLNFFKTSGVFSSFKSSLSKLFNFS
jgi:hypothetical protein